MSLESKEILIDDLKIYSNGLITALKQDKLIEARGYVKNLRTCLDSLTGYLESQISIIEQSRPIQNGHPFDVAKSEAEAAVLAAKRADEKAKQLEQATRDTSAESKRLKKATSHAKREAKRAWSAAHKAEKAERKASKESLKAAEHASTANQAARRS